MIVLNSINQLNQSIHQQVIKYSHQCFNSQEFVLEIRKGIIESSLGSKISSIQMNSQKVWLIWFIYMNRWTSLWFLNCNLKWIGRWNWSGECRAFSLFLALLHCWFAAFVALMDNWKILVSFTCTDDKDLVGWKSQRETVHRRLRCGNRTEIGRARKVVEKTPQHHDKRESRYFETNAEDSPKLNSSTVDSIFLTHKGIAGVLCNQLPEWLVYVELELSNFLSAI